MSWKQHWEAYVVSKWPAPFCKFLKSLLPFCYLFVIYNTKCCEWLSRLRCHMQIVRLPVQTSWTLGQVLWPSLLHEGPCEIQFKLVIMQGWTLGGEVFSFANGSKLALTHPNKWLQTHFVLLAKIIAYVVFWLKHSV